MRIYNGNIINYFAGCPGCSVGIWRLKFIELRLELKKWSLGIYSLVGHICSLFNSHAKSFAGIGPAAAFDYKNKAS